MSTRFYLPSTGAPPSSPAFSASWLHTAHAVRRSLSLTKTNTAIAEVVTSDPGAGSSKTERLLFQYQWALGTAITISGTVKIAIAGRELNDGVNGGLQMRIRVVDSTSLADIAVLYAGDVTTDTATFPREFTTAAAQSGSTVRIMDVAVTSTDAPAGSLLLVELGHRQGYAGSLSSRYCMLSVGDPTGVGDQPFLNASTTPNDVPWVEFSTTMIPPDPPTGLEVDDKTATTISYDWIAPVAGAAVEGYDYSMDGGAITDIGNVTDFIKTGLTPETAYLFEVRSKNAGGASAWVGIVDTTLGLPPGVPANLQTTDIGTNSLSFEWEEPTTGGEPATYEKRLEGGAPIDIGLVLADEETGLAPDTEYLFEVRAVNAFGPSGWSSELASTLDAPAGPAEMVWDAHDERYYMTGTDRGVLYSEGAAVPWNGIIGVTESGAGEKSVLYRDGHIYYSDVEPGDYEGSLNCFFWPDEFSKCLGMPEIAPGLYADYQKPRHFSLSYRSLIGSGNSGDMFGYQIHLVYNAIASMATRTRKTMTNTPSLDEFSFEMVATPVRVRGFRPTAHFIIDTRNMDPAVLASLEATMYGHDGVPGVMPDPVWLYDLLNFGSAITFVDNLDGTWTASGSSANLIDNGDGTIQILNVNGVDHGDGTYTLSDTP